MDRYIAADIAYDDELVDLVRILYAIFGVIAEKCCGNGDGLC